MISEGDITAVVAGVGPLWSRLQGARLLLTGGTGFMGRWLLESLVAAESECGLGVRTTVLARRPDALPAGLTTSAHGAGVEFLAGDVRTLDASLGRFSYVIHAATPADASLNQRDPAGMREIIEEGARRVLALCAASRVNRLLLLSSGAVYRPAPSGVRLCEEAELGEEAPRELSGYHAGKRTAERLAMAAGAGDGVAVTIARPFAFVGPCLPLDAHLAIGNFIGDALRGGPVVVKGTGVQVRSYLYAADMAVWLWTMLLDERAAGRTYNVGSERALTVAEVAHLVAGAVNPPLEVEIRGVSSSDGGGGEWYVPSTERARVELGLRESICLEDAVRHTIDFHKERCA